MKPQISKIAVVGGGSWATALVKVLTDNKKKKEFVWWMRNQAAIEHIRQHQHQPKYLSAVDLTLASKNLNTNLNEAIKGANTIILSVPAAFLKSALSGIQASELKGKKIVSAIKGMVPGENLIVCDFLQHAYQIPLHDILTVAGPCHAEEVALEKRSCLTIACKDEEFANAFASMMQTHYIRTNIIEDIHGAEYAAVLKNIYALASGIYHGLGNYGDNFQAIFICNAIHEMQQFIHTIHPSQRDMKQSAYLGDLLVTAYSQFSRNRTFGSMLGKGYTVKSIQAEMDMVAEGYYAASCIYAMNRKHGVPMPIAEAVYRILFKGGLPKEEMTCLAEQLT